MQPQVWSCLTHSLGRNAMVFDMVLLVVYILTQFHTLVPILRGTLIYFSVYVTNVNILVE
jgi:hypothetical protein